MNGLRLDRFLFFARFAKSRIVAQKMVDVGAVRIDGARVTNRHAPVWTGQVLTLAMNGQFRVIQIEDMPNRRGPISEAQACYCEIVPVQAIDVPPDRF